MALALERVASAAGDSPRSSATRAATRANPGRLTDRQLEVLALLADGRVVPHVGATFPLDRVADALALVATGGAVGKVTIDIGPSPSLP